MKRFFVISTLAILFVSSCAKTEDVALPNNFSGNWRNSENASVNGAANYPLVIEADVAPTIMFAYLYGFHSKVVGSTSNNTFLLSSQIVEGNRVTGSGVLVNANQINLNYVVDNGIFKDTVVATLKKI